MACALFAGRMGVSAPMRAPASCLLLFRLSGVKVRWVSNEEGLTHASGPKQSNHETLFCHSIFFSFSITPTTLMGGALFGSHLLSQRKHGKRKASTSHTAPPQRTHTQAQRDRTDKTGKTDPNRETVTRPVLKPGSGKKHAAITKGTHPDLLLINGPFLRKVLARKKAEKGRKFSSTRRVFLYDSRQNGILLSEGVAMGRRHQPTNVVLNRPAE